MLSFMNINSKEREYTANSNSTRRRTRSQKSKDLYVLNWKSSIWRHVVYVTTFGGILTCSLFRPRDMQEYYMLFGIFARDSSLYSLSVLFIAWADTRMFIYFVYSMLIIVHSLQGSVMEQPLYKHITRLSMT
jgi:hypothetical protein